MNKKKLTLVDFTPETQELLQEFGITEEVDIGKDIDDFFKKEFGENYDLNKILEDSYKKWSEWDEEMENFMKNYIEERHDKQPSDGIWRVTLNGNFYTYLDSLNKFDLRGRLGQYQIEIINEEYGYIDLYAWCKDKDGGELFRESYELVWYSSKNILLETLSREVKDLW